MLVDGLLSQKEFQAEVEAVAHGKLRRKMFLDFSCICKSCLSLKSFEGACHPQHFSSVQPSHRVRIFSVMTCSVFHPQTTCKHEDYCKCNCNEAESMQWPLQLFCLHV